jgi:hypothetical protein
MSAFVGTPVDLFKLAEAIFEGGCDDTETILATITAFFENPVLKGRKKKAEAEAETQHDLLLVRNKNNKDDNKSSIVIGNLVTDGTLDPLIKTLRKGEWKETRLFIKNSTKKLPRRIEVPCEFADDLVAEIEGAGHTVEIMDHFEAKELTGYKAFFRDIQTLYADEIAERFPNGLEFKDRTAFVSEKWNSGDGVATDQYGKKDKEASKASSAGKGKSKGKGKGKKTSAASTANSKTAIANKITTSRKAKSPKTVPEVDMEAEHEVVTNDYNNFEMSIYDRKFIVTEILFPKQTTSEYVIIGVQDNTSDEMEYASVVALTDDDIEYITSHTSVYKYLSKEMLDTLPKSGKTYVFEDRKQLEKLVQ